MKINRFLITLFCTVFFSKIDAMLLPFLPFMFMSSTVVIDNSATKLLSRKSLNWLYAQNPSITSINEIRSNIDYYHEMVKNHYDRLLYKKQNNDQIKKVKLKRLLISTGINASIWTAGFVFLKKALTCSDQSEELHLALSVSSMTLGLFSLMLNCLFFDSYRKHDLALSRNIKRDEHMLKQFEEYKATMATQNRSVKQETT
ncbi:MAG: hypothetical protein ACOYT8_04135 [Candidatus Dependentiae bacterium]